MADHQLPPLQYAAPQRRRGRGMTVALVAGGVAGMLTYASAYVVGELAFIVGPILGFIVGCISAYAATSNCFVAGVVGNLFAMASFLLISAIVGIVTGEWSSSAGAPFDWVGVSLGFLFLACIFVLPGLLGSLPVWEGRRNPRYEPDKPVKKE